jgi:hypothetical protein
MRRPLFLCLGLGYRFGRLDNPSILSIRFDPKWVMETLIYRVSRARQDVTPFLTAASR